MKKITFIIASLIILAGVSNKISAQILDNPPQDVIYYDNDLEDVTPIALPAVRKADIMLRRADGGARLNQENQNLWKR